MIMAVRHSTRASPIGSRGSLSFASRSNMCSSLTVLRTEPAAFVPRVRWPRTRSVGERSRPEPAVHRDLPYVRSARCRLAIVGDSMIPPHQKLRWPCEQDRTGQGAGNKQHAGSEPNRPQTQHYPAIVRRRKEFDYSRSSVMNESPCDCPNSRQRQQRQFQFAACPIAGDPRLPGAFCSFGGDHGQIAVDRKHASQEDHHRSPNEKQHVDHIIRTFRLGRSCHQALTGLATYALLLVGTYVRAEGAGLAFRDWPLMSGRLVPDLAQPGAGSMFAHRLLAIAVTALVAWCVVRARTMRPRSPRLIGLSTLALVLVLAQIAVGALNVVTELATWARAAHVAV